MLGQIGAGVVPRDMHRSLARRGAVRQRHGANGVSETLTRLLSTDSTDREDSQFDYEHTQSGKVTVSKAGFARNQDW